MWFRIPIITPTIPPSLNYTPASPDYSPASDTKVDPSKDSSSDHIPPLPAISPFISSADDTTDSDTPDTAPSPTHGTPFTETTLSTQKSPTASSVLRRRVMVDLDYSSSDHFSSDDSSSSSSLETSLDSPVDALSDFASSHSSSDHSFLASPSGTRSSHRLSSLVPSVHSSSAISERPSHDSSSMIRSCKRSRSPVASVPLSSPTLGELSYAHADLLPSPKRIRSPGIVTDLEDCSEDRFEPYVPREVGLGVDFKDEKIDECFAYADALRDRGIDARVVVEAVDREESETGTRGPVEEGAVEVTYETLGDLVQRFYDHTEAIPVHRIQAIEGVKREQRRRIIRAELAVTILTERVAELERDNKRLRGIMSVESQRVDRL
ncbi:hypothetical protein Tco_0951837 [Tanacetum coccineum]|uniref:Uncharacterized protein n=1 Tax=Tanacetum coccineum TaxID=301880 RepID=A0ABQ5DVA5_9ASTR